jgi:hypothetical protein
MEACLLYPPKADMCSALAHVCYGPKADIVVSPLRDSITARRLAEDDLATSPPTFVGRSPTPFP